MGYQVFKTKRAAKGDLASGIELMQKNLEDIKKNAGYETFNVIRFGRLLEGQAYYHEVDEHYTCVGFEVEVEYNFNFDGRITELERTTGFYSLWVGKSHQMAPIIFDESYRPFGTEWQFDNGYGDHFEVQKVLASVEEVEEIIREL